MIDPSLFRAILAMDSYNRGYDAGIALSGVSLGGATLGIDSSELGENSQGGDRDQALGFYAVSYDYNGQKIISFRGTDKAPSAENLLPDDVRYGWTLGAGDTYAGSQGALAVEFYRLVVGVVFTPKTEPFCVRENPV